MQPNVVNRGSGAMMTVYDGARTAGGALLLWTRR